MNQPIPFPTHHASAAPASDVHVAPKSGDVLVGSSLGPSDGPTNTSPALVSVRENDRPLSCDPITHADVLFRMTVGDDGIITTLFECQRCDARWTERRWRQ